MYRRFFKRLMDFWVALFALILLSPLFAILITVLHFANKGAGAFFYQARPGKDGKIFKLIKFKSMTDEKDCNGNLLADNLRITKIGRIIRKTSLDELAQLINVLKGDMSLIGPRPLLIEYLPLYSEEQARRHQVRPGISGWAQVYGRNAISWEQRFKYDVWYVDHVSFVIDLKIILRTIKNVLSGEGVEFISPSESRRFNGTN